MKNRQVRSLCAAACVVLLFSSAAFARAAQKALTGHIPAAVTQLGLQPLGNLAATTNLSLTIGLPLRDKDALTNLLQQIYEPGSPNFHHYLTPDQFTEMFGPSKQDYQSVIDFATTNGLTVTGTHSNRTLLDVSGTVSDIEKAFNVTMRVYQHPTENRTFYAPDTEPQIPSTLPVLAISGLNNYILPRPLSAMEPFNQTNVAPLAGSGPSGFLMGNDFRKAYAPGVTLDGTGQIVGLLQLDGYFTNDIQSYESQAGLPDVKLQNISLNGGISTPGNDSSEVSLDIEMSVSMAPGLSQVSVYEAPNGMANSVIDILSEMANPSQGEPLPKQLSSSWGIGDDANYDQVYLQFAAQGQSFFQASGDHDAYHSGIDEFADAPYITIVGGTTLTNGTDGAWLSEKVWNWGAGEGSGGGVGFNYLIPSWQQGIDMSANGGSTTLRNSPDVALTADNIWVIYGDNQIGAFGGTSCAAPLWAGFTALINQQAVTFGGPTNTVGFLNPALYTLAGSQSHYTNDFHDIVTGDNKSPSSPDNFSAMAGYDLCTGLGTPNGINLINDLTERPPRTGFLTLSITPSSGSALLNASTQTIFVAVNDIYSVTNATVAGVISGITNLIFLDDGQPPDAIANDGIYSATFQVPASGASVTMKVTAAATNETSVTNTVNYPLAPLPPNDNFANAIKVPAGGASYLSNNRFATIEGTNEPAHDGDKNDAGSLWWTWSSPTSTNVFIDTIGSKIDTVLAIYTGNALGSLQAVVATNGSVTRFKPAHVSFNAQAGATYRIAVAGVSSNSLGSLALNVTPGGQLDTNPPVVSVLNLLSGQTVTSQILNISGTAADPSPNASGVSQVFVMVNGFSATVSGTTNWTATVSLQPDLNVIQISAIDAAGNFSSSTTIEINYLVPPVANDFFTRAIALSGVSGTVSGNNTNATKEIGEPDHAGNAGGKSLWWSFTSPSDGVLTLNTTNSTFDTLLGLYTGTNVAGLTVIAGNDDAYLSAPGGFSFINQAVRANQKYAIAVDGYAGASGDVSLSYSFTPATVYHLNVSGAGGTVEVTTANALGGEVILPGQSGDFASGAAVTLTANPGATARFRNWTGSISSSANPLIATMSGNLNLTANFISLPFTDGFESGNLSQLPWTTAGDAPWFVQTNIVDQGQYAARSGVIGDSQSSSLILTNNFAAGTGSFDYKVSSEANWDFLNFYVDGILYHQASGEVDWANYTFPLTAGLHTLEWTYVKDPSESDGLDAAFIDDVNLPLASSVINSTPPQLQFQRQGSGFLMTLTGPDNQQYVIQTSTDLTNWQNLSTNVTSGGTIQITIPANATNRTQFYRAYAP